MLFLFPEANSLGWAALGWAGPGWKGWVQSWQPEFKPGPPQWSQEASYLNKYYDFLQSLTAGHKDQS